MGAYTVRCVASILVVMAASAACAAGSRTSAPGSPDPSVTVGAVHQAAPTGQPAEASASPSEESLDEWASSASSSLSSGGSGVTQLPVPSGVQEAIVGYATVDANKNATKRSGVDDWISEIKAYSTQDLSSASRATTAAGAAWADAHAAGASLAAKVTVSSCNRSSGWGEQTVVMVCALTTTVTDGAGTALDDSHVPQSWKPAVSTASMQYTMTQDGGTWKVATTTVPNAG